MKKTKTTKHKKIEKDKQMEKFVKQRISKVKTRMKNAEDDRLDRILTRDEFADIYNRLKKDLATGMKELSTIQGDHTDTVKVINEILGLSEDIYDSYTRADGAIKRKYLQTFFDKIIVDDRRIVEVKHNPVIKKLLKIREVRLTSDWRDVRDSLLHFVSKD